MYVLVLPCLRADVKSYPLYFKSKGKQTTKKINRVWLINRLKRVISRAMSCATYCPFYTPFMAMIPPHSYMGLAKDQILRKLSNDLHQTILQEKKMLKVTTKPTNTQLHPNSRIYTETKTLKCKEAITPWQSSGMSVRQGILLRKSHKSRVLK